MKIKKIRVMLSKKILSLIFTTAFLITCTSGVYAKNSSSETEMVEISIKFNEEVRLPYSEDINLKNISGDNNLKNALKNNPEWKIDSEFNKESREILESSKGNFNYYTLSVPKEEVEYAKEVLESSPKVESVQVIEWKVGDISIDSQTKNDILKNTEDNPGYGYQNYFKPAPEGVDMEYAWKFPGSAGEGMRFVDLENGWELSHEDLKNQPIKFLTGATNFYGDKSEYGIYNTFHGTSVLGIVGMEDNNVGGIGGAYKFTEAYLGNYDVNHFVEAMNNLEKGDVILIEICLQFPNDDLQQWFPVEIVNSWYQIIREATDRGIIVIEPAGNGGNNLDYYASGGRYILNRNSSDFRDSGAIMVGANESTTNANGTHMMSYFSTHGSRIDVFAYGDSVYSTGKYITDNKGTIIEYNDNSYSDEFNGTSSASPIVTSVIMNLQGIHKKATGDTLTAEEIRKILSDHTKGTPVLQNVGGNLATVGYMPNLREILRDYE